MDAASESERNVKRKQEAAGQSSPKLVSVSSLSGTTCTFILPETVKTIKEMKAEIETRTGTSATAQRLLLKDRELKNGDIICDIELEGTRLDLNLVKRSTEWEEQRLEQTREHFLTFGTVALFSPGSPPPTVSGARLLTSESKLPAGLGLPESLKQMLHIGTKWNFFQKSYDCFGLNMFAVPPASTTWVFGDADSREEWHDRHGEESVAGNGWALIATSSEFNYYFVNMQLDSPDFGAVRAIVNNCDEEGPFTPAPFERFLDVVEAFAAETAALSEGPDSDPPDDYKPFTSFLASV